MPSILPHTLAALTGPNYTPEHSILMLSIPSYHDISFLVSYVSKKGSLCLLRLGAQLIIQSYNDHSSASVFLFFHQIWSFQNHQWQSILNLNISSWRSRFLASLPTHLLLEILLSWCLLYSFSSCGSFNSYFLKVIFLSCSILSPCQHSISNQYSSIVSPWTNNDLCFLTYLHSCRNKQL